MNTHACVLHCLLTLQTIVHFNQFSIEYGSFKMCNLIRLSSKFQQEPKTQYVVFVQWFFFHGKLQAAQSVCMFQRTWMLCTLLTFVFKARNQYTWVEWCCYIANCDCQISHSTMHQTHSLINKKSILSKWHGKCFTNSLSSTYIDWTLNASTTRKVTKFQYQQKGFT